MMVPRRNLPGLVAGALVTTALTALLFVLPAVVPIEAIQRAVFRATGRWMFGNPIAQLRLFGGIPGGIVAGYLVRDELGRRDTWTSAVYGFLSALLGLLATYLFVVAGAVALGFPPPLLVYLPLFAGLAPVYLFGGAASGFLGARLGRSVARDYPVV